MQQPCGAQQQQQRLGQAQQPPPPGHNQAAAAALEREGNDQGLKTPPGAIALALDKVAAGCKKLSRKTWSDTEKKAVLDLLEFNDGMKKKTLDFLQHKYGGAFKKVHLSTLRRWHDAHKRACEAGNPGVINRKRGKKACTAFEDDVYLKVAEEMDNTNGGKEQLPIYDVIAQAAEEQRQSDKWKSNKRVQLLKFSHKWCHGVLRRHREQHTMQDSSEGVRAECELSADARLGANSANQSQPASKRRKIVGAACGKAQDGNIANQASPATGAGACVRADGLLALLESRGRKYAKARAAGGSDSQKARQLTIARKNVARVKQLEQELALVRQQLATERKRSALLEQQVSAMQAQAHQSDLPAASRPGVRQDAAVAGAATRVGGGEASGATVGQGTAGRPVPM
jgi:hypothetical protein